MSSVEGVLSGDALSAEGELRRYEEYAASSVEALARYERLLDAMEANKLCDELLEECPEVAKANAEVEKLAYRCNVLKQSITEQEQINIAKGTAHKKPASEQLNDGLAPKEKKARGDAKTQEKKDDKKTGGGVPKKVEKYKYVVVEDYGNSILGLLNDLFTEAKRKAFPDLEDVPVAVMETNIAKFGDYQFNSAMAISQKMSKAGQKMSPRDVAGKVLKNVPACALIEKLEIAGPGYINVFLKRKEIASRIMFIAENGVSAPLIAKRRVLVDFSSPNIAKEMHVGHLRSTIIGDSISRLLEYVGFEVLRINHIGDWGTQFGMLIAHLQDRYPDFLVETPPIADLQAFYKESKKRFDEDEEFKARAYQCVVKLQSYDEDYVKAWNMICDVSRKDFNRIYERLDISITERGESFYNKLMPGIVEELTERGFLKIDDGRKLMFPTDFDVPLTVVKSDGGFTYDTSDLAALKQRLNDEKVDWDIYVVDAGQSLHLESIFAAGRDLGWYDVTKKRIEHVGFGLVLGEDRKKFKTRSGDTVRLTELLDEGVRRAAEKLKEKEREKEMTPEQLDAARDAVAYGCIKYADLSHSRLQDYVFSFDRMLEDKGNTAVYLLYAYARIRSIVRNTGVTRDDILKYLRNLPAGGLPLEHEAEIVLAKNILKFSDCVLMLLDSLLIHQLCDYVYNLATTFHDFYTVCYVIQVDKDGTTTLNYNRLVLCEVTADVMATCFRILGIRTVEKM